MQHTFTELRLALRALWRRKTFSILVVMTLAVALGCVAAVLTLAQAVLWQPLPYPDAAQLALLFRGVANQPGPGNDISPGNCTALHQSRVFEDVACWMRTMSTVRRDGQASSIAAMRADASLLNVLRVGVAQGRMFTALEASPGRDRVVVITHEFWQQHLGGRPVLGHVLDVDGAGHTIIGVLKPGFRVYQQEALLLFPLALDAAAWASQDKQYLQAVARVAPRPGWSATWSRVKALAGELEARYPLQNRALRLDVIPMQHAWTQSVRGPIYMLLATTGLLLALGLMNLANLFLARMRQREKEFSIRRSLGANAWQQARQTIWEPLLLTATGGGLGLVLAGWSLSLLKILVPPAMDGQVHLGWNWMVVGWMAALVGAAGLLLCAPLLWRRVVQAEGLQSSLLALEVACAVMLVVAVQLLGYSWKAVLDAPLGMNPQQLWIARVEPPEQNRGAFYQRMEQALGEKAGVSGVAFASSMPLTWRGGNLRFQWNDGSCETGACVALYREVTAGYFKTLEVPLRRGRYLGSEDREGSEPVAVVNETWVRRFAGTRDPIGMTFTLDGSGGQRLRVVGVVADTREMGLDAPPRQTIYVPFAQSRQRFAVPTMVAVRSSQPVADWLRGITTQPVSQVMRMQALLDESSAPRRMQSLVSATIALGALLLAGLGLNGLVAYVLTLKRREMGIRIALGAGRWMVVRTLVARPLGAMAGGAGIGLAGAVAGVRLMGSQWAPGMDSAVLPYAVAGLVIGVLSAAACAQPARQALRIPPAEALRQG